MAEFVAEDAVRADSPAAVAESADCLRGMLYIIFRDIRHNDKIISRPIHLCKFHALHFCSPIRRTNSNKITVAA